MPANSLVLPLEHIWSQDFNYLAQDNHVETKWKGHMVVQISAPKGTWEGGAPSNSLICLRVLATDPWKTWSRVSQ